MAGAVLLVGWLTEVIIFRQNFPWIACVLWSATANQTAAIGTSQHLKRQTKTPIHYVNPADYAF